MACLAYDWLLFLDGLPPPPPPPTPEALFAGERLGLVFFFRRGVGGVTSTGAPGDLRL
jgi:hypothetical protein